MFSSRRRPALRNVDVVLAGNHYMVCRIVCGLGHVDGVDGDGFGVETFAITVFGVDSEVRLYGNTHGVGGA